MRVTTKALGAASAALVALVLAAAAPPAGSAPAPTLELHAATLSAKWKESWLTGTVSFAGAVSAQAQLRAVLRPVSRPGSPAAAVDFTANAGEHFSKTLKLPPRMLPGTYRLSIDGVAGGADLQAVSRDLVNPTPREGIVDRSWASARRGGSPVVTVRSPRKELWATFHFAVPPAAKKISVAWHSPSFRWLGRATKPYKQTFTTYVGAPTGLERGVWFCVLSANGRVVKRVRVRVS